MTKCGTAKQRDLLTGEWSAKPPRRGGGSHVRLKPLGGEKSAVPGMASFAGEGPRGTYCGQCRYFGDIAVQCTTDNIEKNPAGCVVYSHLMGHAGAVPRRSIKQCDSCKYFTAAGKEVRRYIVDQAGRIYRIDKYPDNLRGWRPNPDDTANLVSGPAFFTENS